jgi:O-antigen ligase
MTAAAASLRARVQETLEIPLGVLALGAALPVVFLAGDFQPSVDIALGTTDVTVRLSDLAVLLVVLAAGACLRRRRIPRSGFAWGAACLLLAWIFVETIARAGVAGYPFAAELVTALKYAEYAALAPAVAILVRRGRDVDVLLGVLAVWVSAAAVVGVIQLVGVDIFGAWPAWRRQPSFLGHHDLAVLGGIALACAIGAMITSNGRTGRRVAILGSAGAAALILSGTLIGAIGLAGGVAAAILVGIRSRWLARGPALRAVTVTALVTIGVFAFRGGDVLDFARFLGFGPPEEKTADVESYSQRSVLSYIGLRIFLDHPVVGIGWQASTTERGFEPYLDDARKRFPTVADQAFPSVGHPWGVQNAYVQAAADLGIPGAVLFLVLVLAPAALVVRVATSSVGDRREAAVAVIVITFVVAALWAAIGLVAGIPLAAASWILLGAAVRVREVGAP